MRSALPRNQTSLSNKVRPELREAGAPVTGGHRFTCFQQYVPSFGKVLDCDRSIALMSVQAILQGRLSCRAGGRELRQQSDHVVHHGTLRGCRALKIVSLLWVPFKQAFEEQGNDVDAGECNGFDGSIEPGHRAVGHIILPEQS